MKSILIVLLISASLFAQTFPITKVGTIKATWSESNKDVYSTCIRGYEYYVLEAGYRSGLATVWQEIDHPVLGKIDQPKKCSK